VPPFPCLESQDPHRKRDHRSRQVAHIGTYALPALSGWAAPYCRLCCACRPVDDAIDDNWPSFPNVERGLSTDRTPRCRYGRDPIGRLIDVGLSDSADPSRGARRVSDVRLGQLWG